MFTIKFKFKAETKACYRFEEITSARYPLALYLKKDRVFDEGINPKKGITVTVKETNE